MRLIATITAISLIVIPSLAEAQQYRNRGGGYAPPRAYNNSYRNNGNRYVQNNYYGGRNYRGGWNNGGAIAAGVGLGLLGGLIGGALINQPAYAYPPPAYPVAPNVGCVNQVVGYSASTGQTITQLVCP